MLEEMAPNAKASPPSVRNSLASANIIDLMVVGDLRVGAFERSVGLGDILEFPFAIPVAGNVRMKTLGEDSESRFDLGA